MSGSEPLRRRSFLRRCGLGTASGALLIWPPRTPGQDQEVLPKHVTPETLRSVIKGLDHLAAAQADDGQWVTGGGQAYPVAMAGLAGTALLAHGNTPTRGKYAKNVQAVVEFLVHCSTPTGLITGTGQDSGIPMHGHGFALMFLASVYGMITKESLRRQVGDAVRKGVALTAQGQSSAGGWTYNPSTGDEGSVTVTQVQALRAAQNAGFLVPKATIDEAANYLEKCRTPEGGIRYSLASNNSPQLPISAAAVATLYNAGQFESPIAVDCLKYVWDQFRSSNEFGRGSGHAFYANLYASQGFYMAGNEYWDAYYPKTRDQLIAMQAADGSWQGDGIGTVYGTAIAVIILQLPYKYLPVFQR